MKIGRREASVGTQTAQILLGHEHRNDEGLSSCFGRIDLFEGDRPYWELNISSTVSKSKNKKYGVYPSIDNSIDDAFLLMAAILNPFDKPSDDMIMFMSKLESETQLLMHDFSKDSREQLYTECTKISDIFPKTIISIFTPNSLIMNQIHQLEKYRNAMSILTPQYVREFNQWTADPIIYERK